MNFQNILRLNFGLFSFCEVLNVIKIRAKSSRRFRNMLRKFIEIELQLKNE